MITDEMVEAALERLLTYGWIDLDENDPDEQKLVRIAVRAALEATERASWQPIETAPKDGTTILVYRSIGPWDVLGHAKWMDVRGIAGWLSCGFSDPPSNLGLAEPTHWRPLPEPPVTSPPPQI